MTNIVTFAVLALIIGGASLYIYRAKKRGVKCIGCPSAGTCAKGAASGCGGGCAGCSGCAGHCSSK